MPVPLLFSESGVSGGNPPPQFVDDEPTSSTEGSTLVSRILPLLYLLFGGFRCSGWALFLCLLRSAALERSNGLSLHLVLDPHLTITLATKLQQPTLSQGAPKSSTHVPRHLLPTQNLSVFPAQGFCQLLVAVISSFSEGRHAGRP